MQHIQHLKFVLNRRLNCKLALTCILMLIFKSNRQTIRTKSRVLKSSFLSESVFVPAPNSCFHPRASDVRWMWGAGVRPLLPAGCRQGVARRLPPLQPVSLWAADASLAFLERREHLLPAGLLQVWKLTSDFIYYSNTQSVTPYCKLKNPSTLL